MRTIGDIATCVINGKTRCHIEDVANSPLLKIAKRCSNAVPHVLMRVNVPGRIFLKLKSSIEKLAKLLDHRLAVAGVTNAKIMGDVA